MADTPSNFDPFQELPDPAARADAKEDYARKADALNAALYKLAKRLNVFVAWLNALIAWIVATRTDMATSQDAAAQSVKDAAGQVKLATDQALASKGSADAAKASSDSAQVFAAAAGAAIGVGSLAGNAGKALVVDPGEKTTSFQDVGLRPGDYLYSAVNPGPSYVPIAAGLTANQAAYPKLYARLGGLIDWTRNLGTYQASSTGIYARNGNVIAVPTGDDRTFSRSIDGGATWAKYIITNMTTGNGYTSRQIEYFKGYFFLKVTAVNGYLYALSDISDTGGQATQRALPVNPSYEAYMAQGNGVLVVWHPTQGVSITSDGVNFTYTPINTDAGSLTQYSGVYLFKFTGGYFWASNGGAGYLFRSANGKDWTRLATPAVALNQFITGIEALPSGRLVAMVTGSGAIGNSFVYSDNSGQTWSSVINVPFTFRGGLGIFNNQVVCSGTIVQGGVTVSMVAFSGDGINWTYYTGGGAGYRQDFLWWPVQITSNKLAINGVLLGQHYDPASQFWIPPLADPSVYIKTYVKVS